MCHNSKKFHPHGALPPSLSPFHTKDPRTKGPKDQRDTSNSSTKMETILQDSKQGQPSIVQKDGEEKNHKKRKAVTSIEKTEKKMKKKVKQDNKIYDDSMPLQFFSKSADAEARKLSNFALSWIHVDGNRWFPTVEHYYQSQKYMVIGSRDLALRFSCETRDGVPEVGLEARAAKSAGSKTYMKKMKLVLRSDIWSVVGMKAMQCGLNLKFQLPEFRETLLRTGDRPLHHFGRRPGFWDMHINKETGLQRGDNTLGKMVQKIRDRLRQTDSDDSD